MYSGCSCLFENTKLCTLQAKLSVRKQKLLAMNSLPGFDSTGDFCHVGHYAINLVFLATPPVYEQCATKVVFTTSCKLRYNSFLCFGLFGHVPHCCTFTCIMNQCLAAICLHVRLYCIMHILEVCLTHSLPLRWLQKENVAYREQRLTYPVPCTADDIPCHCLNHHQTLVSATITTCIMVSDLIEIVANANILNNKQ